MITYNSGIFNIETENTSYIFSVENKGIPEHIYYGKKLRNPSSSLPAIREKHLRTPESHNLGDTLLEFSTEGCGDSRTPIAALTLPDKGRRTLSLEYTSHEIKEGIARFKTLRLPQGVGTDSEAETVRVTYSDSTGNIEFITYYTSFYKADVITRRTVLVNRTKSPLTLRSLLSSSLDIRGEGVKVTSFSGKAGSGKRMRERVMSQGSFSLESRTLESGDTDSTLIIESGNDTYLMGLIYSGASRTSVEESPLGITRITTGINPDLFSWTLEGGESFESPEAVLAYSGEGKRKAGNLMKKFIENHIRRGLWKNRMKPVMLDTWDALGYDPEERDVLKMAKAAESLGFEGIIIDDGWFGARKDDTSSLGDWYADTKHFPSGIKDTANEIHYLGLMFGLWFEMESISERSMLYKTHPEWAAGRKSGKENTFLLDFTRSDVQEWVIDTLSRIIESYKLDYIRWSVPYARTDFGSNQKDGDPGEFMHRYITGLYHILDTITKTFPNIYIEGASSGGMRFDMGMLSYASSILISENSDPLDKLETVEGTGMIYPLSVMTNMLSSSPDKLSGRTIDEETKFNTSAFGVIAYSINPVELSPAGRIRLTQEIDFYKAYRPLLQYGTFTLEEDSERRTIWTVSNGDGSAVLVLYYQKRAGINTGSEKLYIECANENYDYSFMARIHMKEEFMNELHPQELECYSATPGDALKRAGIALMENSPGSGYEEGMRTLTDNSSRLYIIKRIEEK